uniref:SH3 domain-containing protein n=1 Tax=Neogobius melanostomus TaxID=47308 RepID=A0A8C6UF61_9GOBI
MTQNRLNMSALYDNTAECPDELAFRKGDILTVMEQNVAGTSGWWMCSLYGRQGLAPGNRLRLLSQTTAGLSATLSPKEDKPLPSGQSPSSSTNNIYQIPSVSRSNSAVCKRTELLYKVPSTPMSVTRTPGLYPWIPEAWFRLYSCVNWQSV